MRTSKVVGFSIPPVLYKKFNDVLKKSHKTKSEFFREMISLYFNLSEDFTKTKDLALKESDIAKVLRMYWELKSSKDIQTIIIGLGIVIKNGKVLIGSRKNKDPHVKNLTWVFPGGKMDSLDFAKHVKKELKQETNLDVEIKHLITARVHPDTTCHQFK